MPSRSVKALFRATVFSCSLKRENLDVWRKYWDFLNLPISSWKGIKKKLIVISLVVSSYATHVAEEVRELCGILFHQTTNPIHERHPHNPSTFPNPHFLKTSHGAVGFQHMTFGGHKHSAIAIILQVLFRYYYLWSIVINPGDHIEVYTIISVLKEFLTLT